MLLASMVSRGARIGRAVASCWVKIDDPPQPLVAHLLSAPWGRFGDGIVNNQQTAFLPDQRSVSHC